MDWQRRSSASSLSGVTFPHPGAFWFGTVATTIGVILHLPMYLNGRDTGYRLVGMPVDEPMLIGMVLIIVVSLPACTACILDRPRPPPDWPRISGCALWTRCRFVPPTSACSR